MKKNFFITGILIIVGFSTISFQNKDNDLENQNTMAIEEQTNDFIPNTPTWYTGFEKEINTANVGIGERYSDVYDKTPTDIGEYFYDKVGDSIFDGNEFVNEDYIFDISEGLDYGSYKVNDIEKVGINSITVELKDGKRRRFGDEDAGIGGENTNWHSKYDGTYEKTLSFPQRFVLEKNEEYSEIGSIDLSKDSFDLGANTDIVINAKFDKNEILHFNLVNAFEYKPQVNSGSYENKGSYHFTCSIKVNFDVFGLGEESNYSLTNDEFGGYEYNEDKDKYTKVNEEYYDETQKNFYDANADIHDIKNVELAWNSYFNNYTPFFTNENTYSELENYIIKNEIIVSKDNIPFEFDNGNGEEIIDVIFYDENGVEIPESDEETTYLNSSLISFELTYNSSETYENGENKVIGGNTLNDDIIMYYHIPYVNMELKENSGNVYNFYEEDEGMDADPSDNENYYEWTFDKYNSRWVLNTNTPFEISALNSNGVATYSINNQDDIPINENNLVDKKTHKQIDSIDDETLNYQNYVINFKDYGDLNETEAIHNSDFMSNIYSIDEGEGFTFEYNFIPVNTKQDDVKITIDETTEDSEDIQGFVPEYEKNTLVTLDLNNDSLIQSDEIFSGSVVTKDFSVSSAYGNNVTIFKYDEDGWSENFEFSENQTIDEEGIYGIQTTDEYGDVRFEVIEYDKTATSSESSTRDLQNFIGTDAYDEDLRVAKEQGVTQEKFNNLTPLELRYIDQYTHNDENMVDLSTEISIDENELSKVTNKYESGTNLGEIENELSNEINKQISSQTNLKSNHYNINFQVENDGETSNDIVYSDSIIHFTISPSERGEWKATRTYEGTFESNAFFNINNSTINDGILTNISSNHIDGSKFDSNDVVETKNRELSSNTLKEDLENEILFELETLGMKSEYSSHIKFKWSFEDNQVIHYDDFISVEIYSTFIGNEYPPVKGTKTLEFQIKPKKELSKYSINTNELSNITNQYFNGAKFTTELRDRMNEQIYNQLILQGVEKDDITINWTINRYNPVGEYYEVEEESLTSKTRIYNKDVIHYYVVSNSDEYFEELSGSFMSIPTTSLSDLYINENRLMEITNKYTAWTDFKTVKTELENYLNNDLTEKSVDTSLVKYEWNISDEEVLAFNDQINLSITSLDEEIISGKKSVTFSSLTYYDLNVFEFDDTEFQEILDENSGENVKFSTIQSQLEKTIYDQLEEQGFNTDIITISWNKSSEEYLRQGDELSFELVSIDFGIYDDIYSGRLENEIISNTFNYETVYGVAPVSPRSITWLIVLIIILILITILIIGMVGMIIKKRKKTKRI